MASHAKPTYNKCHTDSFKLGWKYLQGKLAKPIIQLGMHCETSPSETSDVHLGLSVIVSDIILIEVIKKVVDRLTNFF